MWQLAKIKVYSKYSTSGSAALFLSLLVALILFTLVKLMWWKRVLCFVILNGAPCRSITSLSEMRACYFARAHTQNHPSITIVNNLWNLKWRAEVIPGMVMAHYEIQPTGWLAVPKGFAHYWLFVLAETWQLVAFFSSEFGTFSFVSAVNCDFGGMPSFQYLS